jgi:hypothetical protein
VRLRVADGTSEVGGIMVLMGRLKSAMSRMDRLGVVVVEEDEMGIAGVIQSFLSPRGEAAAVLRKLRKMVMVFILKLG